MAQTPEGAIIVAARRIGIGVAEYKRRVAVGEKWCFRGKHWRRRKLFRTDSSRYDGLYPVCAGCRNSNNRKKYVPCPRPSKGRSFVPARDGDKLQARRRINYFVEAGIIPRPDDLPCHDCNHFGNDRRHEYDHYLGYAAVNHEKVQAVCDECHCKREKVRRGRAREARHRLD